MKGLVPYLPKPEKIMYKQPKINNNGVFVRSRIHGQANLNTSRQIAQSQLNQLFQLNIIRSS